MQQLGKRVVFANGSGATRSIRLPLPRFYFYDIGLTNDPQPVTIKKITYYPQPFSEITNAEYEDAEVVANKFAIKPSGELLAELAAVLLRPGRDAILSLSKGGLNDYPLEAPEPYMQFNSRTNSYYTYQANQKIKYFKKLPAEELYSIFMWYAGNRAQLPLMFPTVYEGGTKEEKPDLAAFTKCIHMGAGPKNGTRQQIRMMRLYEFMFDMEQEAIHAKEMEAEYEKMKHQT